MPRQKTVAKLADELFHLIEKDQGYAFFSDGTPDNMPRDAFFADVRRRMSHNNAATAKMAAFLKKYGEE